MSIIAFVEKINSKSGTNRNGKPYTLYSMKLADKDGNELPGWYQLGFDKPVCKEGDYVKLEATPKGNNFDVVKGTVQVSKNPPAKAPTQRSSGGGGGGTPAKTKTSDLFGEIGGYNTEDDIRRMSYSAARHDAVAAVAALLQFDALPMSAAKSKAGQADRFESVTAAIDKLTVQFFFDAATGRKLETVADNAPDTGFDAPLPEDEFLDEGDEWDDVAGHKGGEDDDDGFE